MPHPSPPPGLVIRARDPGDAGALNGLAALPGFRRGTLQPPFPSPESTRQWIEGGSTEDLHIVGTVDGQVVAATDLLRGRQRRLHVAALGMGVHDDWQGRGIGTAILAAALEAADSWMNLRRIELFVFADNAPALALYRRFGFVLEGRHTDHAFRDGAYADSLSMARLRR